MTSIKTNAKVSRKLLMLLFDLFCFAATAAVYYLLVLLLGEIEKTDLTAFCINSMILFGSMLLFRAFLKIYLSIWRYAGTGVYAKILISDACGGALALLVTVITNAYRSFWDLLVVCAVTSLLTLGSRFAYRLLYKRRHQIPKDDGHRIEVAIVGAGQIGVLLANDLLCNKNSNYKPMFFIDRDTTKVGSHILGLKVYPENDEIIDFIKERQIKEIFIALTNMDSEMANSLYERYSKTSCKIKVYDIPIHDAMPDGKDVKPRGVLHDFSIEDLLFRQSLSINSYASRNYYNGKTVLITGGGGSIGSELCRQIAKCNPAHLIVFDIYENNAYDIQQELVRRYGEKLRLSVEIGSVRDRERLESVFRAYRPNVVFHAAAHKHVPLMEHCGAEAIKNNVLGTYNTADMAEKYGVGKFILVSTDKAVNPTNVMGASKRMCEMIVQCRTDSKTDFAAVRFGNVLGSNGSVIPLFRRQIAEGGPITITDKRIIRYFMTIPEASQLVMQAGAMAKKGELFVLDMGKPVHIYDLAVNMIRLCGLEPEVDIKIEEIGLRPGEKLYEELLIKTETLTKTDNEMIFIETDTPLSRAAVEEKIEILCEAVRRTAKEPSAEVIREAFFRVVPTFHTPEEINEKALGAEEMKQANSGEPVPAIKK